MGQQNGKFILFDVAEFGCWLEANSFSRMIKLLQVHHTLQPDYDAFRRVKDHFSLLNNMEHCHVVERGFSDIAQHLTTFPDGLLAVCRPIDNIPAGIKGANQYGICVEHLGNFDDGQDVMTAQQRECIVKVYAHLCRRFRLLPDGDTIQYHHWWDLTTGQRTNGTGTTKSCPGTQFFSGNSVVSAQTNFIPLIRQELSALGSAAVDPLPSHSAEVAADALNVRTLPSPAGDVLKQLKRGVEVCIYEERDGWSRIDPVSSCWVLSHFLRPAHCSVMSAREYARVTADLLNVRSVPSAGGRIVTQLERGSVVRVYEERENWTRIDEKESRWVFSCYLSTR